VPTTKGETVGSFRWFPFSFTLLAVVFAPAILALWLILHFSVNVPQWDEWDTPGNLYQRIIESSVTYQDFFSQHNESRMAFPKLIFAAVGSTVGWNVIVFMMISWLFVLCTFTLLFKMLPSTGKEQSKGLFFTACLLSMLLFSPSQAENQLYGLQITVFILPLLLALCLWLQTTSLGYGLKVTGAALFSFIATFSFSNGMVCWLMGFPFFQIWLVGRNTLKKAYIIRWTALYLVCAIVTISFYFWDYIKPEYHPSFDVVFKDPVLGLKYLAALVGAPFTQCSHDALPAIVAGTVVLCLFTVSLFLVAARWKSSGDTVFRACCYPFLSFSFFGIVSVLVATSGRAGFGVMQALSGRYSSSTLMITVGLVGIIYTLWFDLRNAGRSTAKVILSTFIVIISLFTISSWACGIGSMQKVHTRCRQNLLTLCLLDLAPRNPLLSWLHPKAKMVRERSLLLREHDILKYESVGVWLTKRLKVAETDDAGSFRIERQHPGTLRVEGWAMLPNEGIPPEFVIMAKYGASGKVKIITGFIMKHERPDVVEAKKNPRLLYSGFGETLKMNYHKRDRITMWAVDLTNKRAYILTGMSREDSKSEMIQMRPMQK
jgi:hypothetical protein